MRVTRRTDTGTVVSTVRLNRTAVDDDVTSVLIQAGIYILCVCHRVTEDAGVECDTCARTDSSGVSRAVRLERTRTLDGQRFALFYVNSREMGATAMVYLIRALKHDRCIAQTSNTAHRSAARTLRNNRIAQRDSSACGYLDHDLIGTERVEEHIAVLRNEIAVHLAQIDVMYVRIVEIASIHTVGIGLSADGNIPYVGLAAAESPTYGTRRFITLDRRYIYPGADTDNTTCTKASGTDTRRTETTLSVNRSGCSRHFRDIDIGGFAAVETGTDTCSTITTVGLNVTTVDINGAAVSEITAADTRTIHTSVCLNSTAFNLNIAGIYIPVRTDTGTVQTTLQIQFVSIRTFNGQFL